jgi:hypothetical protein
MAKRGGFERNKSCSLVLSLVVGLVGACAQPAPVERAERVVIEAPMNEELAASLHAEVLGDTVHMALRATNATGEVVDLTFPSGQSFDFVVLQDGREVWRWSEDRMFTQAIRHERMEPGETRIHEAEWVAPAEISGEVLVRGFLTAQEHRLEQQIRVRLP